MKSLLTLSLLLLINQNFAQKIWNVYFDYGKSKPTTSELDSLDSWLSRFEPDEVDSIVLIGYADSTGRIENNLKLSLKRALFVRHHIEQNPLFNYPIAHFAKGEKNKRIEVKDRRVLIKVWLKPRNTLLISDTMSRSFQYKRLCYIVDYELLQACHITYLDYKKKQYVKLTIENDEYVKYRKIKYFYITRDSNNTIMNPVKWVFKESGKDWYKRKRFEALVPKASFEKNYIVYYDKLSCDSCFKDTLVALNYNYGICMARDIFLNRNTKFKFNLFSLRSIKIKVPKEYLDSSKSYYDGNTLTKIYWKSKKRKPDYMFSKLDFSGYSTNGIYVKLPCCGYRFGGGFACERINRKFFQDLIIETGLNKLRTEELPYIGAGFNIGSSKIELSAIATMSQDFQTGYRVRFKYHYFKIPLALLNPVQKWKSLDNSRLSIFRYMVTSYIGTEFRKGFNTSYSEQDLYIGVSVDSRYFQLFTQYGSGYRFKGPFEGNWNRLIQFGCIFHFVELFSR